jgi:threonylcarbamoyladenosine tRNA methylthiotransferase MtaB
MKTVAFHTLGCKVNQYETDAMQQLFEGQGYEVVPFQQDSDVYVVNTCTVTNMADKKSRQIINKAKKTNPDSIIVVVGCYAQAAAEVLEKDESIDIVIGNNKKNEIVQIVEQFMDSHDKIYSVMNINDTKEFETLSLNKGSEKTRAYIKVQDGCNQFCSYCIIPYMRGRVRSRELNEIVAEIKKLVNSGNKEIVLTGIHLASYGIDLENTNLIDLIQSIHKIEGLERIRFGSLEPNLITEEFVETIANLHKVCPHFHLSLQSGCDSVLKRMNRKYSTDSFYNKVLLLRQYYEMPAITTDIIVGFPGETEKEFETTLNFVHKVNFADVHVFKYSKRAGTKAASFPNQVTEKIKQERSQKLIKVTAETKEGYLRNFLNQKVEVLFEENIEEKNHKKYAIGHTSRYIRVGVGVPTEESLSNKIKTVEIEKIKGDLLIGKLMPL